jgi:hypothetical protein
MAPSLSSPVLPLTRCVIATGDAAGHGTPYGAQDEVLYLRHASGCGALARSTGLGELPTSLLTYNRFMPRPAEQPPSPLPLPLPPLLLPPIPRHDPRAHSSLIRRASPCTPGVMYLVPALDWTGLDWTALHCTALHCIALHYTALHRVQHGGCPNVSDYARAIPSAGFLAPWCALNFRGNIEQAMSPKVHATLSEHGQV